MNKIICIIPARKGSKRITNKNTKNFFGKPIIQHVIENLKKEMNLMRLAFKHVPLDLSKIIFKIIKLDKKISSLTKKLS